MALSKGIFNVVSDTRVELRKGFYKQIWNDEHTSFRSEYLGDVRYAVEYVDEDHIRFVRGVQSKVVYIKRDDNWAYSAQKTQIKAMGGAKRLFEHTFCHDLWHNCTTALADHAIDVMRPANGYESTYLGKAA